MPRLTTLPVESTYRESIRPAIQAVMVPFLVSSILTLPTILVSTDTSLRSTRARSTWASLRAVGDRLICRRLIRSSPASLLVTGMRSMKQIGHWPGSGS